MKEEYKDTPIGLIPKSWEINSLEAINIPDSPISYGVVQPGPEDSNGIRFIRGGDIKKGKIGTELRTISKVVSDRYSRTLLKGGELLISLVGYPGECAVVHENLIGANIARQVGIIRLTENNDKFFIQQYLSSPSGKKNLLGNLVGSAQQVINLNKLRKVQVPLPPLPEQQKIAEILSTVDEKIELINQQITETQALKKGLMQRLLTKGIGHTAFKDSPLGEIPVSWEVVKLGTVLKKIIGGGTPSKEIPDYWNGEIPWATVKDLKKTILTDTIDYISEQGLKNSSANLIPGWTLITSTRMALGRAVFFKKDVAINQDLKALFPKDNLDKHYLFHWFFCNSDLILSLGSGSTVKGIRLEVLKGLKIALPPIKEQSSISHILSTVDEKLATLSNKKTHYQELKQGLMQQLLTGKIRVKTHNPATA